MSKTGNEIMEIAWNNGNNEKYNMDALNGIERIIAQMAIIALSQSCNFLSLNNSLFTCILLDMDVINNSQNENAISKCCAIFFTQFEKIAQQLFWWPECKLKCCLI